MARQLATVSGLSGTECRSVCWKFFLGLVNDEPNEKWIISLNKQRELYEKKKEKYLVDPHQQILQDTSVDNPLSVSENSAWEKFFENKEVEEQVNKGFFFFFFIIIIIVVIYAYLSTQI
jgi:hypothetical protein